MTSPEELFERFRTAIEQARDNLGLTQEELAKRTGRSQSSISTLNSRDNPYFKTPQRLASLCNAVEFDNPDLLREICSELKFSEKEVELYTHAHALKAYCPKPSCIGVVFVPGEHVANIVPSLNARRKYCRWCGEKLIGNCRNCSRPIGRGAFCDCGDPYVECPDYLLNLDAIALREQCESRNTHNERMRQLIANAEAWAFVGGL